MLVELVEAARTCADAGAVYIVRATVESCSENQPLPEGETRFRADTLYAHALSRVNTP